MSIKVKPHDPIVEAMARKLFGIETVPQAEVKRMIRRSVQVVSKMVGKLRSEIEEKKLLVDTAKSCIAADAAAIVDLVRCRQREIDLLSKIQKWSGLISCSESVNWAIRQEMEEVLKQ